MRKKLTFSVIFLFHFLHHQIFLEALEKSELLRRLGDIHDPCRPKRLSLGRASRCTQACQKTFQIALSALTFFPTLIREISIDGSSGSDSQTRGKKKTVKRCLLDRANLDTMLMHISTAPHGKCKNFRCFCRDTRRKFRLMDWKYVLIKKLKESPCKAELSKRMDTCKGAVDIPCEEMSLADKRSLKGLKESRCEDIYIRGVDDGYESPRRSPLTTEKCVEDSVTLERFSARFYAAGHGNAIDKNKVEPPARRIPELTYVEQSQQSQQLIFEPTKDQIQRMNEIIYQDPRKTRKDVEEIRNWINNQSHLPNIKDMKFIENFLMGCKYDVQKTKTMMDKYFCARDQKRHFFENRDPLSDDIKESFEVTYAVPMPRMTPEGYRVVTVGLLDTDPGKFSFLGFIRRNLMLVDLSLTMETSIGLIAVTDCSGMSIRHVGKINFKDLSDYLYCSLDAAPVRVKGIHLVNLPALCTGLVSLLKTFLPQTLKERVHTHSNLPSLHAHVPKDILPLELGGSAPSVRDLNEKWYKFFTKNREWFLTDGSKRADTKLLEQIQKETKKEAKKPTSSYWGLTNFFKRK